MTNSEYVTMTYIEAFFLTYKFQLMSNVILENFPTRTTAIISKRNITYIACFDDLII